MISRKKYLGDKNKTRVNKPIIKNPVPMSIGLFNHLIVTANKDIEECKSGQFECSLILAQERAQNRHSIKKNWLKIDVQR
jgi:hypothetical protein